MNQPSETPPPANSELTPQEVYAFFAERTVEELSKFARDAVAALDQAQSREQALEACTLMAPFFLDCTYPRLNAAVKKSLQDCLDNAEAKYGSLAKALGLSEPDDEDSDQPGTTSHNAQFSPYQEQSILKVVQGCLERGNVPTERPPAARLAALLCELKPEDFERLSDLAKAVFRGLSLILEERLGPIDILAAEFVPQTQNSSES